MKRLSAFLILTVFLLTISPAVSMAANTQNGAYGYVVLSDGTVKITKYYNYNDADVIIPPTIDDKPVTIIGKNAFNGAAFYLFTGSIFPDQETEKRHSEIKRITIPDTVKYIEENAFRNVNNLQTVVFPAQLKQLDYGAFLNCENLSEAALPAGTEVVGENAFTNCKSLRSVVLPYGLREIGDDAFRGCVSLTSIDIPGTVKVLGERAFQYCYSLESAKLNQGTTAIYTEAFFECFALTRIDIPNSVKTWGSYIFNGSDKVTIYCQANSSAHRYAKNNKIAFSLLGETTPSSKPSAVSDIKASAAGADRIKITWRTVDGALGYEIQRSVNNKQYKTVATVKSASYTNTGLKTGTKYYYRVRAFSKSGSKKLNGEYSKTVSATPKLLAPKAVTAVSQAAKTAKITWKASVGASGYEIQRGTSKSNLKTVKTLPSTTYSDKNLKSKGTYYFRVRAYEIVDGKKVYGGYSPVVKVKIK